MTADEQREDERPEWQRICPDCDGTGVVWPESASGIASFPHRCGFCRGKGVVDVD